AELFLHDGVGVEQAGEAVALAQDAQGVLEQGVGRFARQLEVGAGLQQVHLIDDVQQQVRELVRSIRTVAQQAADVDVREIRVSAAFGGGDADLGRGGVIVELDEEAFQQLAGGFFRQRAVGKAALVEGQQVLIEMSRAESVPAVQF